MSRSVVLVVLLLASFAFAEDRPVSEAPTVVGEQSESPEVAALVREGYEFLALGNYEGAIRKFRAALKLDPGHRKAKYGVGACFIKRGQYKEALAVHEALYKLYSTDFELLNNFAWMLATAKDPVYRDTDRAIQLARDAILIAPDNHHVWSTLSEAHYAAGQFDKSYKAAVEALRLSGVNGAATGNVSDYERQVDKSKRAMEAFSLLD